MSSGTPTVRTRRPAARRWRTDFAARTWPSAVAAVGAAAIVAWLAFHSGGYFPTAFLPAGAVAAALCGLAVLADASGDSLGALATQTTEPGAIVHTDGLAGYRRLRDGFDHRPRPATSAQPGEQLLPRAHRAISNLKAWLHGTTAASAMSTWPSTSTSTSSATTGAAPPWRPSRRCWASAPCTNRPPTTRSPDEQHDAKRNQPDTH